MSDNITLTPERQALYSQLSEVGDRIGHARDAALIAGELLDGDEYDLPSGPGWLLITLAEELFKAMNSVRRTTRYDPRQRACLTTTARHRSRCRATGLLRAPLRSVSVVVCNSRPSRSSK
jgi:hypothetical protein